MSHEYDLDLSCDLDLKERLIRDSEILLELPLGSILPSCKEITTHASRCKRPYAITQSQLERQNPDQDFVGRDENMTQEAIDNTLKALVGFSLPLPPR